MKTNPKIHPLFTLGASLILATASGQPPHSGQPGARSLHSAVRHHFPPRAPSIAPGGTTLGDPLPGLTSAQLADFGAGLDEFENEEDVEGGLGPVFNHISCVSCHNAGGTGGASAVLVTRFGRREGSSFDPLASLGGSLLQDQAIDASILEQIPAQANVIAHRQSTPLFGLGLIEAIPDAVLIRLEQQSNRDGVSGRAARIYDIADQRQRIGRFGWKSQLATLLSFAGDAYVNEMGVTNRLFPEENAPNGQADLLAKFDKVADPEDTVDPVTGKGDIDAAADFMRLVAPPSPLPLSASAKRGKLVFEQVQCAICHTPSLRTGPSPIAALSHKPVNLYSDLLLHDMGALGDGIVQGDAQANELRTPPLWGLRVSAPYLHDGRASNIEQAIRAHDGEALNARRRFENLPAAQRQQLIDFLKSI